MSSGSWREALHKVSAKNSPTIDRLKEAFEHTEGSVLEIRYHLNIRESRLRDRLVVDLMQLTSDGLSKPLELPDGDISTLDKEDDRIILGLMFGASGETRSRGRHAPNADLGRCSVRPSLYTSILPKLAQSGRFYSDLGVAGAKLNGPLAFAGRTPFGLRLSIEQDNESTYKLWGTLVRTIDEKLERLGLQDASVSVIGWFGTLRFKIGLD